MAAYRVVITGKDKALASGRAYHWEKREYPVGPFGETPYCLFVLVTHDGQPLTKAEMVEAGKP